MTTKVDATILVNRPVSIVYNQWTQFEDFPRFMGGVQEVTQLDDRTLEWVAEIAGVKRRWRAEILEQVPDVKIAWAAAEGATNAGAVFFEPAGTEQTTVRLHLEYEPEGLVEQAGDRLHIVERQAQADLERFKAFIESEEYSTGAWRGEIHRGAGVGTPGVADAAFTRSDSGKAGISGAAAAAGAAVAAGAAGVVAARGVADKIRQAKQRGDDTPTLTPEEHTHHTWIDRKLVDRTGRDVGTITDVFYDDAVGQPMWLSVSTGRLGMQEHLVPFAGALEDGEGIRVSYDLEQIEQAPARGAQNHLDRQEEEAIRLHYGMSGGVGGAGTGGVGGTPLG